jgi:hypothetical protein
VFVKNPAAQSLAALAKGKPKRFSKAERERRRQQMKAINNRRKQKS